jgi:hypothetical protein
MSTAKKSRILQDSTAKKSVTRLNNTMHNKNRSCFVEKSVERKNKKNSSFIGMGSNYALSPKHTPKEGLLSPSKLFTPNNKDILSVCQDVSSTTQD